MNNVTNINEYDWKPGLTTITFNNIIIYFNKIN